MPSRKRTVLIRFVSVLLVCLLIAPAPVFATTTEIAQPYASAYLTSYNTYICPMGGGDLQIWFTVVGDTDMDYIGTMSIRLYESTDQSSWKLVKTFLHEDYSSMLAEDDYFHSSYVSYDGTAGKYYKAYVCIYAGIGNSGDTRYMWTSVKKAT